MLASCERNNEKEFFDFTDFQQAGMANESNIKLLIYINLHNSDFSKSTGLEFSCMMGMPKQLKPYIDSKTHDVLFLIDTPEDKIDLLKERLEGWCFDRDYLIVHSTPPFFKKARRNGVQWLSCLFNKDGVFVDLTNPSLPNFKKLMGSVNAE